jgi:hypothetical protein
MKHRIKATREETIQGCSITHIADNELRVPDSPFMARDEIVVDHDFITTLAELANDMGPNVASPAGY